MFCTQCGAQNAPEAKFCTTCGNPMAGNMPTDDMRQAKPAVPPVPLPNGGTMPVRVPLPTPAQPASASTQAPTPMQTQVFADPRIADESQDAAKLQGARSGAQAGAEATVPANRKFIIGGIVTAIVLIAAAIAGIVTYNLELWGGKSLPEVTVPASTSDSSQAVKADVVIKQLESKGLKAKQSPEFSGLKKGMFLGYDNAKASQRVKQGSTVTVRVSAGPGVPKDTVGKKAETVVKTFSDMGVPVHYKQVPVSESSSTKEGTVVSTSPTPGQGVTDESTGIYIGVATKSDDGLPSDIVGQDVETVQSSLEAKGYSVKIEQRLSSKQNVGKVSGADPGPGSKLSAGQTVTLYEGVDAKGAKPTFMQQLTDMDDKTELSGISDVAAGKWCNNAGDCITLGGDDSGTGSKYRSLSVVDGASIDQYAMSDYGLVSCDSLQQAFCGMSKHFLLEGDSGAFELFPRDALAGFWCGDEFVSTNGAGNYVSCKAGRLTRLDPDDWEDSDLSDAKVHMTNYFVVVPTGSDLNSLETNGFFDSDALAEAKKQKSVDTDRPFLLYRNPELYGDKATASYQAEIDQYLPSWRGDAVVKMKPAPSDETAYYLVEYTEPDWDSLDDADIKGASDTTPKSRKSGKANEKSAEKTATDMTPAEISTALSGGDFSPIAGEYCMKSGKACLTVDATGKVTSSGDLGWSLSPDDPTSTTVSMVGNDHGWNVPSDVGVELRGPDGDYRCGSERGFEACYNGSKVYPESDISKPANLVYVFKGADSEQVKTLAGGMPDTDYVQPDSSKPFIKLLYFHMNTSPSDTDVFYLVQ